MAVEPPDDPRHEDVPDEGLDRHGTRRAAAQHPRPDHQVAAVFHDRPHQVRHLFRVVAVVAVQEHDDVRGEPGGLGHAAQAGRAITAPGLPHNDGAALRGHGCRPVRRPVVHHDHGRGHPLWDMGQDQPDRIFFIQGRNDDHDVLTVHRPSHITSHIRHRHT